MRYHYKYLNIQQTAQGALVRRWLMLLLLFFGNSYLAFSQVSPEQSDTAYHFVKTPLMKLVVREDSTARDSIQLLVQGIKQGRVRLLTFIIQNVKDDRFAIEKGQKAYIYINNGATVQLSAGKTVFSTFGGMSYGNYISSDYALSIYDLDYFGEYNASHIKLERAGGVFNFDLDEKAAAVLRQVLAEIK